MLVTLGCQEELRTDLDLFRSLYVRPARRWPVFITSAAVHGAGILFLALFGEALFPQTRQQWLKELYVSAPLVIRMNDRLLIASSQPRPAPPRITVPPAPAPPSAAPPEGPADMASAPPVRTPPRPFELPPVAQGNIGEQTILQPDSPPYLVPQTPIALPNIFFWATNPKVPRPAPRAFVMPGHTEQIAEVPDLDAPPQLELPNREARAAVMKIASAIGKAQPSLPQPPATTVPVRVFRPPVARTQPNGSVEIFPGDPANIFTHSDRPIPLRDMLTIPAGNVVQLPGPPGPPQQAKNASPAVDATGRGSAGASSRGPGAGPPKPFSAPTGQGAGTAASVGPSQIAAPPGMPQITGQQIASLTRPGVAPVDTRIEHLPGPGQGLSANGSGNVPGSGPGQAAMASAKPGPGNLGIAASPRAPGIDTVTLPAPAVGLPPIVALRQIHPTNGVFDIVVVQNSSSEAFPESTGVLSGRPIYTVFLQVGAPKDWILQYCIPKSTDLPMQNGPVVRLGNPAPVKAPYPLVTMRPPLVVRQGGSYLLIHGYVDEAGRFKDLNVVRGAAEPATKIVLTCLAHWEFRPATRDGVPVRVEILLAIPA
jgi:hypothetical protein